MFALCRRFGVTLVAAFMIAAIGGVGVWAIPEWSEFGNFTVRGNVGVGEPNPTEKLEVFGTVKATAFQGDGSGLTGVVLEEADPVFTAWDKSSDIVITESQISDLQSYLTAESDPIFSASVAAGITTTDTANWDAAYNTSLGLATVASTGSYNDLSDQPAFVEGNASYGSTDSSPNDAVYVDDSGNVGIGTTSPTEKLEVDGIVRATNFEKISDTMQWDITNYPENQTTISWSENSNWVVQDVLSQIRINHSNSNELTPFDEYQDGLETAKVRRWYVTITDLPESATWPNRVINATFFGYDSTPSSVIDGSTFGEISIWEASPSASDEIVLVIDFTKTRSQEHQFGVQVLITHEI